MKTAEEWIKYLSRLGTPTNSSIMVIEAIQQDAFLFGQLKGMMDAAEICTKHGDGWRNGSSEGFGGGWTVIAADECNKLILTAHDKLKGNLG